MKKAYLLLLPVALFFGTTANVQSQNITTIAGLANDSGYAGDGQSALNAKFSTLGYLAVDDSDNIYIADSYNNRIRKVYKQTGVIITYAGVGIAGYTGDYGAADSAEIYFPFGLTLDKFGNLYFTDNGNGVVRKIVRTSGKIYTIAGNGDSGSTGNGSYATAASFSDPTGIAVDNAGNVYIADDLNNNIRVVTASDSIINLYAGNGIKGYSGDGGPAIAAELNQPEGIAFDTFPGSPNTGNLYIAEIGSFIVQQVNPSGTISTISGTPGTSAFSVANGTATTIPLDFPTGVACDFRGNAYVADAGASIIREINLTSNVGYEAVIAGDGNSGYGGNGGAAINAELNYPFSVCMDTSTNFFIADVGNFVVRAVGTWVTAVPEISVSNSFSIYPDPASTTLNILFPVSYKPGRNTIEIIDLTGKTISIFDKQAGPNVTLSIDISGLSTGMYFVKIADNYSASSQAAKFIKE